MNVLLVLKESMFDCRVIIADSRGQRQYYLSAACDEGTLFSSMTVEVFDPDFFITLIPETIDTAPLLDGIEENDWKDRWAKKATKFLLNSLDKIFLRAACRYRITGAQEGDRLDIALQMYAFGTWDHWGALELIPMCYLFFEVFNFNDRYLLTDAYEVNRREVLKFAKMFTGGQMIGNGLLFTLFTYPIQVGRVKHLSKNKKIAKVLTKFNRFSECERQRFLEKQERFFGA